MLELQVVVLFFFILWERKQKISFGECSDVKPCGCHLNLLL